MARDQVVSIVSFVMKFWVVCIIADAVARAPHYPYYLATLILYFLTVIVIWVSTNKIVPEMWRD